MQKLIRPLAVASLMAILSASISAYANGDITTTRTANGFNRTATRTGVNGKTMTHNGSVGYNAANQSATRNSSTILPDGKTTSSTATVTKTASGSVRDASVTGPNGKTYSTEVTRTRDNSGSGQ